MSTFAKTIKQYEKECLKNDIPAETVMAITGTPKEVFKDPEKLKKMKLDVPFSLKLSEELQACGLHVSSHITQEGLVEELCQLHSSM